MSTPGRQKQGTIGLPVSGDALSDRAQSATGRKHHIVWRPKLHPPALLAGVCVVLVGPKKPISCGTVARACSCFECEDVRVVQPRCDHNTRSSRSVSKGAQYILWRAQVHDKLADALGDVDLSVAFTRWLPGQQHPALPDIPSLLAHPVVQQVLAQPQHLNQQQQQQQRQPDLQNLKQQEEEQVRRQVQQGEQQQQQRQQQQDAGQQQERRPVRIALVFGREEFGLSDDEVAACGTACAISIGRLQESLSLSHATSIVLSQLYQARLSALAAASGMAPAALPYSAGSVDELANGYDSSSGIEH
ncbi:Alpha/beta knot methyltransferase [Scenedesmus sp. NREL 46B-D3]|nr:Alpha/beta knot methyltransferase [Scenedesmus sp. NREL 46B-D3]